MMRYRPEFERLYWAELYWLELEEQSQNSEKRSPLEEAMDAFRRDGLKGWELEKASIADLEKLAKEVSRCCIALTSKR